MSLAALRTTLGLSFLDDGYYAAVTLRLAHGARLFVDEMPLQTPGFLLGVPFVKAWIALFGTTGFVVALRLFYVAVAAAGATVANGVLRPSFGRWPALLAPALVLLAPPYNLLAISYNTMGALGITLACLLAFASVRDSSRPAAIAAGAAAAFASVSYPPLVVAAFVLLAAFALLGRDRRLTGPMVLGAAIVVGAFLAWLLARASLAELRTTADYVLAVWADQAPRVAGGRLFSLLGQLLTVMRASWIVPVWAWYLPAVSAAVLAALRPVASGSRDRMRLWAAALLPALLGLPVFATWFAHGRGAELWTLGGNYLTALTLFALPAMLAGIGRAPVDQRRLTLLTLPVGLVGLLVVDAGSGAGLYRASGIVGLAPLAVAALVWWAVTVREAAPAAARAVSSVLVALVVIMLFGATFKDAPPLTLHRTITSGPYAGVTTSGSRAASVAAVQQLTSRWVRPTTGVLVAGGYFALYVLQPGVMVTNAVWLSYGASDAATIRYFEDTGRWPDVAFVPTVQAESAFVEGPPAKDDPLLRELALRYMEVDRSASAGLTVFVRK